jgi:phosphatidylethanolamine/phosphatidyl-N-methylethanolamine N-methyltransferase
MRLQDFSRDDLLNYWYEKHYQDFTYNKYTKIFQKYFHSKLETKKFASTKDCLTLEIAANMGEHLIFVEDKSNYYMLDRNLNISNKIQSIQSNYIFGDGYLLPFKDNTFDRIVITCLLHHVPYPDRILKEVRRTLKPNGNLSLFLPSDPGFLFRLVKKVGRIHLKRSKVMELKKVVDAYDHIGNVWSLSNIITHIFSEDIVRVKKYPFNFNSYDLNLFSVYQIQVNKSGLNS